MERPNYTLENDKLLVEGDYMATTVYFFPKHLLILLTMIMYS